MEASVAVLVVTVVLVAIGGPGGLLWLSPGLGVAAAPSARHRVTGDDEGNLHVNTSDPLKSVFINGVDILGAYRTLQEEVALLRQNVSAVLAAVSDGSDDNPVDTTVAPGAPLLSTTCDAITAVPLPSGVSDSDGKWVGGVYDPATGRVFGIPHNEDKVLVASLEMADDGPVWDTLALPIPEHATGPKKWHGGVLLNSKVYGIPYLSNHVLIIDANSNDELSASTQELPNGYRNGMVGKWVGAGVIANTIYCIPQGSSVVLTITPALTSGSTGLNFETLTTFSDSVSFMGALQLSDDTIIGLPGSGHEALVVTAQGTTRREATVTYMCSGVRLFDSQGLALPCGSLDSTDNAYLSISSDANGQSPAFDREDLSVQGTWWGVVYTGYYLVALPDNSDAVLAVSLVGESSYATGITVTEGKGRLPSFAGAVAADQTLVVGIPHDSPYMMVVDTSNLDECLPA